jgi:hypothetical protein
MMIKILSVAATFLFAAQSAYSQSLAASSVSFVPNQLTEKGHFSGCGATLKLINDTGGKNVNFAVYSLSIWIKNPNYALSSTQFGNAVLGGKVEWKTVDSRWVRVRGGEPINHLSSTQGQKSSLLSPVSTYEALEFLSAAIEQKTIQVGVTTADGTRELVFYGAPAVNAEARSAFLECLKEFHQKGS